MNSETLPDNPGSIFRRKKNRSMETRISIIFTRAGRCGQGLVYRISLSLLIWAANEGQDIDLRSSLSWVKQHGHTTAHTNSQLLYKKNGVLW